MPDVRVIDWVNVFVVRSHRYSRPSSLLARTLWVAGSTTAVLMHHSRTAFGWVATYSSSGVTPATVRISFITDWPVTGSVIVTFGSRMAIRFTPSPPTPA